MFCVSVYKNEIFINGALNYIHIYNTRMHIQLISSYSLFIEALKLWISGETNRLTWECPTSLTGRKGERKIGKRLVTSNILFQWKFKVSLTAYFAGEFEDDQERHLEQGEVGAEHPSQDPDLARHVRQGTTISIRILPSKNVHTFRVEGSFLVTL